MAKGNPNPDMSGLRPYEKGTSGNPGGKTAQQRADEVKAAEISARLRLRMLEALDSEEASVLDRLDANTLKLFKDSEDRAHGTPKATTEVGGVGGGPVAVTEVRYKVFDPKDDN